ncbi:MAG: tripartite tricarboxylate transporter TctB family protein, partial [Alphaproteobacteria bacterium]|nr:tripartite tricarboxylate transporter TctB family protein [Alphaproteobacteria bacterium]
MIQSRKIPWLGLGVVAFGVFLLAIAIPYAVTSPSNVRKVVLAPTFWPMIVSWLIIMLGGILVAMQLFAPAVDGDGDSDTSDRVNDAESDGTMAWMRLAASGGVMLALIYLTSVIGMVWTTMLCFG